MKKIIKIFSTILAVIMVLSSTSVAFAYTQTYSKYDDKTYTHNTRFDALPKVIGIDVSAHNKTIDFNKVKADGIDFVYVRVGYTGYTKSKLSLNYDPYYQTNIANALAAGLQVGVYWYSQAVNESEASQEANMLLNAIAGYNVTLPVVDDYEFAGVGDSGRLDSANLSKDQMTANSLAFLNTVAQRGYVPCLYANKSFLENRVNASQIAQVAKIWLAHYNTVTGYAGDYEYWQFTSSGKVDGISGRVDMNVWYQGAMPNISAQLPVPNASPQKVTGVKLKKRTNTTLTFTWNKQDLATYYNIYKYDFSADKYVYLGSTQGNINSYYIQVFLKAHITNLKFQLLLLASKGQKVLYIKK